MANNGIPDLQNQWQNKKISDLTQPPPPFSLASAVANPTTSTILQIPLEPQGEWGNPYITSVSILEGLPYSDMAESLLRWLNKLVWPIMEQRGWTVDHLTEFYPNASGVLGQNTCAGTLIQVRLRDSNNASIFRDIEGLMSTMAHELSHNSHMKHDGNFQHLWNDTNNEMANPRTETMLNAAQHPRFVVPDGYIAISTGGQQVLLETPDWWTHFSIYAFLSSQQDGLIHIPREYTPSVVARLIQLAKGLDPADDKPLWDLPNYTDYWTHETGLLTFADLYTDPGNDATHALALYLNIYNTGEQLGWHSASRNWLLDRVERLLRWYARLGPGTWTTPQPTTREGVSLHLASAVRSFYDGTTAADQPLRGVVVDVMEEVLRIHRSDIDSSSMTVEFWEFTYDADQIDALLDAIPELKNELLVGDGLVG